MKIVTFTPNPAIDCLGFIDKMQPEHIMRTDRWAEYPGGKGINVSRVLHAFGFRTTLLSCAGGLAGQELMGLLTKRGLSFSFYRTSSETRRNYIFEDTNGQRFKINTSGSGIGAVSQQEIADWALLHCCKGDIFYIGGSLPEGMNGSIYPYLAERLKEKGVKLALDVSARHIAEAFCTDFSYLKANAEEIAPLIGDISTQPEKLYPFSLQAPPEREILVTCSSEGALLFFEGKILRAKISKKREGLCCGCGDSMFAVYLKDRLQGMSAEDSLKNACAAGLACAFSGLYELADPKTAEQAADYVSIVTC